MVAAAEAEACNRSPWASCGEGRTRFSCTPPTQGPWGAGAAIPVTQTKSRPRGAVAGSGHTGSDPGGDLYPDLSSPCCFVQGPHLMRCFLEGSGLPMAPK